MLAKRLMPRLPFPRADVLLIDRIGKDISGTGMDPNVVGRKFDDHKAVEGESPQVRRIAVRRLSKGSHGNAIGLGMAEFCRWQLLGEIDVAATRLNGLASGHIAAVMTPLDYPTDREMLAAALRTVGLAEPPDAAAAVDRRYAAPRRGGMLDGLPGRGPAAGRTGSAYRPALSAVRRRWQFAGELAGSRLDRAQSEGGTP